MDLKNENIHVLGMVEAVTKVGLGKPVFILSRIYPETPISALTTALGFVEIGDKSAPAVVDEKPGGKKPGPKKKALPKAEPEKPAPKPAGKVDVGKIRACYTANPPRDPDWIAGEMGLTRQEVVVILEDMDIYRGD